MLVKSKAIVISSLKYAEADLIVKCFTQEVGLKSYLLRGVLKSRKGKLRAAMFQPGTQLELEAFHKNKNNLNTIKDAKVIYPYQSLHVDIYKSSVVLFLSEVLRNAIQEEEANIGMYQFLESTFLWFDTHEHTANFHIFFLIELSKYLGFYPDDSSIELSNFNLESGSFQEEQDVYTISQENIETLRVFLATQLHEIHSIQLSRTKRNTFIEMLLDYYSLHLQGFKKPKSLQVLNTLFA